MNDVSTSVKPTDPLRLVLQSLQHGGHGICVVTDNEGRIVGTLTDGDCRRALLGGKTLESPAVEAMHTKFIAVDQSFSLEQIQSLMRANDVRQIPVVDDARRLIKIVSERSFKEVAPALPNAALILAGGQGTRLRPLTRNVPKPMLPVGGKPMLEHLVTQLVQANIHSVFLSINYLGHVIQEYFGDGSKWGCRISYLSEEQELGTGGPLKLLEGRVDDAVLVLNGDLVTTLDFGALLDCHHRDGNAITVGVSQHETKIPFGVVRADGAGRILSIEEKPTQKVAINAGIYVVEPRLIPLIPPATALPMTSFIQAAIRKQERVGAFMIHEIWDDIGMPASYMHAQNLFNS